MTEAAERQPPVQIRRIAVIGAGMAGRSFALACASAGFHVVLEDVMPANLRHAEAAYADLFAGVGRLELSLTVEEAVREADLAVDFVPDDLESKLEIFSLLDRMAPPRTILCTPSEALSITDLASCVYRPERCVAVRGQLVRSDASPAASLRVLYPQACAVATLLAVEGFLRALGIEARMEADPDAPMLVKNTPLSR